MVFARIFKCACLAVLVLMLSACVTTEKSAFTRKADKQQALEYSVQLARQYISAGNWEAAKRHLKYAIEADSHNPQAHEGLALVFQNTGELELAEEHFKKALRLDRDFTRARNNYAVYLYQLGRYEEACEELETVVEDVLYEGRMNAFLNLGRCYVQLKELEKAANVFNRAYLMDRQNPLSLLELADINFRLNELPKAQSYYDQFNSLVKSQSARSLWLGIRLADKFGDLNASASYGLALKSMYPKSEEYLAYQAYLENRQGGR